MPILFCLWAGCGFSHSFVDERPFLPSLQGLSFSNICWFKRGFASLPKCQVFSPSISSRPPVPSLDLDTDASDWSGVIGPLPSTTLGRNGNSPFPSIGERSERSSTQFPSFRIVLLTGLSGFIRQYGSLILFEENGFSSSRRDKRYYKAFTYCVKNEIFYLFLSTSQDV